MEKLLEGRISNIFRRPLIHPSLFLENVHYYHPNFKMSKNRLRDRNIYPHPRKYPNLYFIGESIILKQGWIEGSLETVECFLRCLSTTSTSFSVEEAKGDMSFMIIVF